MKYLLFVFDEYYPIGGWNDLVGMFDTLEEAKKHGLAAISDSQPSLVHAQVVFDGSVIATSVYRHEPSPLTGHASKRIYEWRET